jgi:hypothetical protein
MSRSQIPNDPELTGIELALGGLIPVPSGLDRDRLMFQAGAMSVSRSSSRRDRWTWPSVAAALALVVACESVLLARRPEPRVVERIVVVRQPAEAPPERDRAEAPPAPVVMSSRAVEPRGTGPGSLAFLGGATASDHQRLEALILQFGLDAFPEPVPRSSASGGPADPSESSSSTAGALRAIELEKLLNPGGHS